MLLLLQNIKIAPYVEVRNTFWRDMQSLRGLVCPGVEYRLLNNAVLSSLEGLENIEAAPDDGPLLVFANNLLATGRPLAPIRTLALCSNGGSILSTPIEITVINCQNKITTYNQLCKAIDGVIACPL